MLLNSGGTVTDAFYRALDRRRFNEGDVPASVDHLVRVKGAK
jgi:hypothetical protein